MYIRFYFTFLTLRWIDNDDGPSADTVDTEFTITLSTPGDVFDEGSGLFYLAQATKEVLFARHDV